MVRTGRGSTVKDPLGGSTDKERRGVTHYSYGEGTRVRMDGLKTCMKDCAP